MLKKNKPSLTSIRQMVMRYLTPKSGFEQNRNRHFDCFSLIFTLLKSVEYWARYSILKLKIQNFTILILGVFE